MATKKKPAAKTKKPTSSSKQLAAENLQLRKDVKRQTAELNRKTYDLRIESSLERVRTVAMGMRRPEDLLSVCEALYSELLQLGFTDLRNAMINIHDDENASLANYDFSPTAGATVTTISYSSHPFTENLVKKIRTSDDAFAEFTVKGRELHEWRAYRKTMGEQDDPKLNDTDLLSYYFYSIGTGAIGMSTYCPISDEKRKLLKRFRNVFDFAYRRFRDVTKAEAQARESQIQLALERVRARTMAMQSSSDLVDVANVLREQMGSLNQPDLESSIVHLYNDNSPMIEAWYAYRPPNLSSREIKSGVGIVPKDCSAWSREVMAKYNSSETSYTIEARGEKLAEWYKILEQYVKAVVDYDANGQLVVPEILYYHFSKFSGGALLMISNKEPSSEACELQKRTAVVFGLAYTRFLDLQKAESQAREATIEAALEKVRGQAMAMHSSNDLSSTSNLVFTELRKLGISPIRCGVGLLTKESRKAQLYSSTVSANGDSLALIGWVELSGHPVLTGIYDTWLKGEDYFPVLSGEELKTYYQKLLSGLSIPVLHDNEQNQYGHFLPSSVATLYAWSEKPYNEAEIRILKRFASIIDLTFRRYIELQKSEANAREAVRQSSLDRIRAEIASMRTTGDLERITPLIWKQLTTLGVPFIRCGVFIMDNQQQQIHTFLATPDGKALAAFHIPYTTPGKISQVVQHWKDNKKYTDRWGESDFQAFADTLEQQGALSSAEQYMSTVPAGGFHLHFLPFLQGMLYVGNTDSLGEEDLNLLQTVADAFSTAYARYDDFNRLDSAKQQIEQTLADLKLTQAQLVQSEKMASLGELTAGIAHEIQNPLNFVNNFSEVSNELIDEMVAEVKKGNYEDANAIANDVKQNLEKILHHGKRADGIVKGMLQHSRSSSGTKEPTDINALADEYLRLAYHGLRAKDKSFNAKFETAFDESVGKVNVIPQDIGRVVLNLITNSFYSVAEKRKQQPNGFEPIVIISTKKENGKVFISVKDNGNGIPQKALDKIFQPFFTTKPTGQGTGLGLSMSYDIVKAHGGEFKVETKEGKGAEFIIDLPIV